MATTVSGTFEATGDSAACDGGKPIAIDATFAGAATVNVQWQIEDEWRTLETFTASFQKVYEAPGFIPVRLNCSAYTDDVTYVLTQGV